MSAHASSEATRRYAARFSSSAAPGHFREPVNCAAPGEAAPLLSSIGIGTYLGEPDAATDRGYTESVIAAVEGGINVVDTAINYRHQKSERSIGAALRELARKGFSRQEIFLATKGGYITPDADQPGDPGEYLRREYLESGILRSEDIAAGCHAMSPSFLASQLERSLKNLGVDCIDLYYLHNPETQLQDVSRQEFFRRLRQAFEFFESAAGAGKIRFYGLATWNGFRQPAQAPDYLSLSEIETTAREIAGGAHRFRFVQLPFNLAMTEALTRANQPAGGPPATLVEAAAALEINLVASASLLQSKLARGLPSFIRQALGLENDAERAIQFARSAPGMVTALAGMSRPQHVQANLRLVSEPAASGEQFAKLFARGENR